VVKSLFAFGQRVGYLSFNVAAAVKMPTVRNARAERILDEEAVLRLIALEPKPRNRALLRLLYAAGLRVSEATALRWRDTAARNDAGQVTVQLDELRSELDRMKTYLSAPPGTQ